MSITYKLHVKGMVGVPGNMTTVDFEIDHTGDEKQTRPMAFLESRLDLPAVSYDIHVLGYLNFMGFKMEIDKHFKS